MSAALVVMVALAADRIIVSTATGGRAGPWGAAQAVGVTLRHDFGGAAPLFSERFVALTLQPVVTPSSYRVQAALDVQPLSVVRARVGYEQRGWFGPELTASGRAAIAQLTLQAKLGPFALQNVLGLTYQAVDLARDRFEDPALDAEVPSRGWLVSETLTMLLQHAWLGVGPQLQWLSASGHVLRPGAVAVFTLLDRQSTVLSRCKLAVSMTWNAIHPSRAGAVPTVALALTTESDLWAGGR